MSTGTVRFVQAGHFRLEQPCVGLAEAPDHLADLLIDAPYVAAEQVFETAIAQEADFLLLCGDVLDPRLAGPRGVLFLIEQCRRLAERQVPVYWVGGRLDPPCRWPAGLPLPENVHVFPDDRPQEVVIERNGEPALRLAGMSAPRRGGTGWELFEADPAGLPTVAAGYAAPEYAPPTHRQDITFWALGGRGQPLTAHAGSYSVHCAGSPQGRSPLEPGSHGCTLVTLERSGEVTLERVATDVLRYVTESPEIALPGKNDVPDWQDLLLSELSRRIESLQKAHPKVDLVVDFRVAAGGTAAGWLGVESAAAAVLQTLRARHGSGSPMVWTNTLEIHPSEAWPEQWQRAEDVRADYLKIAARLRACEDEPLGLEDYLPAECPEAIRRAVEVPDAARREAIVCEAARLGARLLAGEEKTS